MALSELELSNEYNNCYFISLINVLNGIAEGAKLTKYGINDKIAEAVGDTHEYLSGKIADEVYCECSMLFDIAPDMSFRRRIDVPIPICLSVTERIYIKAIINSRYGKLFLSEKEIEEIIATLGDVPDIPINDYFVSIPQTCYEYSDSYIGNMRLLLSAIKENREIEYSNTTRTAEYKNVHGYPVRIEYSAMYDIFQLSLWSSDENRPVKVNIHTMYNVSVTDNVWNEFMTPLEMMKSRRCNEPIVIELGNDKKTFERANILFSMYEIETEYSADGTHIMKLYYYEFDEYEIINTILSFGPYVKVVSPSDIIEKIKERIKNLKNKLFS